MVKDTLQHKDNRPHKQIHKQTTSSENTDIHIKRAEEYMKKINEQLADTLL